LNKPILVYLTVALLSEALGEVFLELAKSCLIGSKRPSPLLKTLGRAFDCWVLDPSSDESCFSSENLAKKVLPREDY
jgi:hypothetical protein